MKFRPVMLLWMAVVFAAAPAWADRVPCCDLGKGSTAGFSADVAHGFGPDSALFGLGSGFFTNDDAFFSSSFSGEGQSGGDLRDLGFLRVTEHTERGRGRFDGPSYGGHDSYGHDFYGHDRDRDRQGDGSGSSSVPEPGSLSLLLVGLTAVIVLARKR